MTPEQKFDLIRSLVNQHHQIVAQCMKQSDNTSKVVPDSVKNYTDSFMDKLIKLAEVL